MTEAPQEETSPVEGEVVEPEPTRALAVVEEAKLPTSAPPSPGEWVAMTQMANAVASTEFVPRDLRNRPEAILACILTGRELGIGPMQALKQIAIVDGKPTLSAELMVALVRRAGHQISGTATDQAANVVGRRADTGDTISVEWTTEMAKRANLLGKNNWRQYPEAMLWARAVSQLCRELFPDVLVGCAYTPEELGSDVLPEYPALEVPKPSTPRPSGARTSDGADTKGRTGGPTDAQVRFAVDLFEKLVKTGKFDETKSLEQIAEGYQIAVLPEGVEATFRQLTGGRNGSMSKLIEALKDLAAKNDVAA